MKSKTDEFTGQITITSPDIFGYPVTLIKHKKKDFVSTTLFLQGADKYVDYNAKGIYIKFDDGTSYNLEDAKVSCHFIDLSVGYSFIGSVQLTEENIDTFTKKKIVKYKIGPIEKKLTEKGSDRTIEYIKCMQTM